MKHRSMILGSVVYLLPACLLLAAGLATYRLFSSGLERRDFAAELGVTATPKLSRPDHVVIVIEENKSFDDIIKSVNAPYLKSLTQRGALLTDFYALHHPSQPNYLEFFAGGDQKVFNDDCLTTRFVASSLGGNLINKGLSFVGYAEDLPADLSVCEKGHYAIKHCPWLNFTDVPAENAGGPKTSKRFDPQFWSNPHENFDSLPTLALVIPNLLNDMHDHRKDKAAACNKGDGFARSICFGDEWLRANLDAYARWSENNNSLLIVTWDEDSDTSYKMPHKLSNKIDTKVGSENQIATVLVGAMVKPGSISGQRYTHYDLLRTLEDMYGLARAGGSQTARDITDIWK